MKNAKIVFSMGKMTFAFRNRMSLPGFEPGAFRLGGEPSIQLRYRDRTIPHYNTASWRENQVERKRKKVYPIREMPTPERERQERCCIGSAEAAGAGEGALHGKNQKKEEPPQRLAGGQQCDTDHLRELCAGDRTGDAAADVADRQPQRAAGRGGCDVHRNERDLRDGPRRAGYVDAVHDVRAGSSRSAAWAWSR